MKYLATALLFISSQALAQIPGLSVTGNTISWTFTGGWMEVQNASTWQTVPGCSGFITSCTTPGGTFNVIDHDNNTHSYNVTTGQSAAPAPAMSSFVRVDKECVLPQGAQPTSFRCMVSCPAGKTVTGVLACNAGWRGASYIGSDEDVQFHSDSTTASCVIPHIVDQNYQTHTLHIVVSAGCM